MMSRHFLGHDRTADIPPQTSSHEEYGKPVQLQSVFGSFFLLFPLLPVNGSHLPVRRHENKLLSSYHNTDSAEEEPKVQHAKYSHSSPTESADHHHPRCPPRNSANTPQRVPSQQQIPTAKAKEHSVHDQKAKSVESQYCSAQDSPTLRLEDLYQILRRIQRHLEEPPLEGRWR